MSPRATRVARGSSKGSSRGSSWCIFFPSASSVLASSPRDDDAKGAGRSRHARFRRGRSDAAPLPTQRWHARTFTPGDARGARLRAADLVDRTPPPRICRGRNADAAPRAETFAIALARARQCAPRRAKHARRVRFFVFASLRIPNTQTADCSPYAIVSVVLRHWQLQLRVEISIEGSCSSCLCCLPLRLSSPNPPARQRDGARFGETLRPAGAMAPLSRGVPALISSPALMSALLAFRYARARRRVLLSSSPPGRFDAAGDLPD